MARLLFAAAVLPMTVSGFSLPLRAADASYYYACAYDRSYMYEEADLESDKIAVVPEGGVCRVIGEEGNFLKVFSGGYTGYMKASWLDSSTETMENVHSEDGIAADKDISIYAEADASSTVVAERKSGATELLAEDDPDGLDELEETDGWICVEYVTDSSGHMDKGWVRKKDVTPARIVTDAEPFMGEDEDDGILIASSEDLLIEEANKLREKAESLRSKIKKKGSSSTQTAKPGTLNRQNGTVLGPSGKETYYNLNMNGVVKIMRRAGFSEEEYPYWVREDGVKMLGPYIMCAADLNLRPRGSLVESSLGTCIVADTGDFIYANPTQIDIAVTW